MMENTYYTLPLDAKKLIGRKAHDSCNLMQSVANYIHLVNTSCFGECAFDKSFGCSIWLVDFDNLKSTKRLREFVQESLYESLLEHEKRLSALRINVKIKQEELLEGNSSNAIKKRVDIHIRGKLKKTNEDFSYVEYFYIGPLSY
ncbi:MAG: GPW/gp25 family protein [Pricia sp.]